MRSVMTARATCLIVLFSATMIACSPAKGGAQVTLERLEVTQAIQDQNNCVSLIAGKTTVVRAYFTTNAANPIVITGTLVGLLPDGSTQTWPSNLPATVDPADNNSLNAKRIEFGKSLDFTLPASWIAAGSLKLNVQVVQLASSGGAVACSGCGGTPFASLSNCGGVARDFVTFKPSPTLRLKLIGIQFQHANGLVEHPPRWTDFVLIRSWLARAFPVAPDSLIIDSYLAEMGVGSRTCLDAAFGIRQLREADLCPPNSDGSPCTKIHEDDPLRFTHYVGLVFDGGDGAPDFMTGCSSAIIYTHTTFREAFFDGTSGIPTGPMGPAVPPWQEVGQPRWDTDSAVSGFSSYGDWYTGHELGHVLGRYHIGGQNPSQNLCQPVTDYLDTAPANQTWVFPHAYPITNGQLSESYDPSQPDNTIYVGFDTGGIVAAAPTLPLQTVTLFAKRLAGDQWHDMMTYCVRQWIGAEDYEEILRRLCMESSVCDLPQLPGVGLRGRDIFCTGDHPPLWCAMGTIEIAGGRMPRTSPSPVPTSGPPPPVSESPVPGREEQPQFLRVIATLNLTQHTVQFISITRTNKPLSRINPPKPNARVHLLDAEGHRLGMQVPVIVFPSTFRSKDNDQFGSITAVIPYVRNASAIQFELESKDLALKFDPLPPYKLSRSAPTFKKEAFVASLNKYALRAQTAESIDIKWDEVTIPDPRITYSVQISPDGKSSWRTIAVGLTVTSLSISKDQLKGFKERVIIKVIAGDGFNSTAIVSVPVDVPKGGTVP